MESKKEYVSKMFNTIIQDETQLIIPLLNEMFGKRYTGEESVRTRSCLRNVISNVEDAPDVRGEILVGKEKYSIRCYINKGEYISLWAHCYEPDVPWVTSVIYLNRGRHTGFESGAAINVLDIGIYDMETILQKNLLILLPFYIMYHVRRTEKDKKSEVLMNDFERSFSFLRDGKIRDIYDEHTVAYMLEILFPAGPMALC